MLLLQPDSITQSKQTNNPFGSRHRLREEMQDAYWWLHGKQGHDLQQVILDDISDDAILVEIASSPLCPKIFTEDDLHIPDEAAAPQGLKDQVGKPQHLQPSMCTVVKTI